jgi:hypothetical protein
MIFSQEKHADAYAGAHADAYTNAMLSRNQKPEAISYTILFSLAGGHQGGKSA